MNELLTAFLILALSPSVAYMYVAVCCLILRTGLSEHSSTPSDPN